ncbi:hypothetical protein [Chondromyces apiculatus]|uniref:Uncharacterized protein n=1 Tax=Chondromyces apiculatus DSM 436 TaxID=1192034 RepID=A0A017T155_9BACT|nr:hypothetical protein [Chondromyces apiculatus]EYF02535.1 Hypothetical protein CAP_6742 [Chondromyces apiculatus DSM 436]
MIKRAPDNRDEPLEVAPARFGWGETTPFEGFVPSIATAGALAAELDRVLRGRAVLPRPAPPSPALRARWFDDALTPAVAACRVALAPPLRVAFDAAVLVLAELHAPAAVPSRALLLCRTWSGTPEALREIATIADLLNATRAVEAALRVLRSPLLRPSAVIEELDGRLAPDFGIMDVLIDAAASTPSSRG